MYLIFLFLLNIIAECNRATVAVNIGLSPNGKATDSDSVIFKVRILVAQRQGMDMFHSLFCALAHMVYVAKATAPSDKCFASETLFNFGGYYV